MDEQKTSRTDDADARGEHDYGRQHPPRPDEARDTPPLRAPNSYVAGGDGTQQVTTPDTSHDDKAARKSGSGD